MNRFPSKDSFFEPWVTPADGELSCRLAVSKEQVVVSGLPKKGVTYREAATRLVNTPGMDRFGNHVLSRFENGPDGWLILWFVTPKAEDQRQIRPYRELVVDTKAYEWPAVLYAVNFASDFSRRTPRYKLNGNGTWDKTTEPLTVARRVIKQPAFGRWPVTQRRYLKPTEWRLPNHPQPQPEEVEWWANGKPERLVALHPELRLPSAGDTWNLAASTTAAQSTAQPGGMRLFPSTNFADWEPYVISDAQRELEDGSWERVVETLEPPPNGEVMSI